MMQHLGTRFDGVSRCSPIAVKEQIIIPLSATKSEVPPLLLREFKHSDRFIKKYMRKWRSFHIVVGVLDGAVKSIRDLGCEEMQENVRFKQMFPNLKLIIQHLNMPVASASIWMSIQSVRGATSKVQLAFVLNNYSNFYAITNCINHPEFMRLPAAVAMVPRKAASALFIDMRHRLASPRLSCAAVISPWSVVSSKIQPIGFWHKSNNTLSHLRSNGSQLPDDS